MRYFLGFLSTVLFLNCSSVTKNLSPFNKLEIETLVADSLMNIRALELTQKNVVAVSSLGDVYRYNLEKQSLVKSRFLNDSVAFEAGSGRISKLLSSNLKKVTIKAFSALI